MDFDILFVLDVFPLDLWFFFYFLPYNG